MASIAVVPIVLKDVTITLGSNGYEKHVESVRFIPSTSIVKFQGMTPTAKFTDVTAADWTCELKYAQDWATTNSLSKYLFANEGTTVAATFKPKSADTPSFAANLTITPGEIGGAVNAYAKATVTLGSDKPVLT